MNKNLTSLQGFTELMLPRASNIDPAWLNKLVPTAVLELLNGSREGSRLLTRQLYKRYRIAVPSQSSLQPQQQWLLLENRLQKQLARRLGSLACATFIRTSVKKEAVKKLSTVLGHAQYRALLTQPALPVTGLHKTDFDNALLNAQIADFLTAVGVALLELTLHDADPFFKLRIKFVFPPRCLNLRPQQPLAMEKEELAAVIENTRSGLNEGDEQLREKTP